MAFDEDYLKTKFAKIDDFIKRNSESVIRIEENIKSIKDRLENTENIHAEQLVIARELASMSTNFKMLSKDVAHMTERLEARTNAVEERQIADRKIFEERQASTGKRIEQINERLNALDHKPAEEALERTKSAKAAFRNALITGAAGVLLGIALMALAVYLRQGV